MKEYKRFLLLHFLAETEETFTPSHWVKIAWENHIVETASYRRFCYEVFGKFIHS